MLYNLAKHESVKSMYISLEQNKNDLLEHMSSMGMSIDDVKDYITIETLSDLRKESKKLTMGMNWLSITLSYIKQLKETKNFDVVVVDSFNALLALSKTDYSRVDLMEFFEGVKNLGLTAFLIYETPKDEFAGHGAEEFLADGIVKLTMERRGETVTRHLNIVKMRKTKHATDYFPLLVNKEEFKIVAK